MLTRRAFLKKSLSVGAVAAAAVAGYSLYEPHRLEISRFEIPIRRLPPAFDGFRIVHLTDLHYRPFTTIGEIEDAVSAASALQPDLVCLTGDYISMPMYGDPRGSVGNISTCARALAQLRSRLGTIAVLGNHDVGTDPIVVAGVLHDHGIEVLRNRALPLDSDGSVLWIAGLDDGEYALADVARAMSAVRDRAPVIMLSHEPDLADQVARYPVDLQLSGHSHGGQIVPPLLGALYLPPLAHKYWRGRYRVADLELYTNRGLGTIGLPMRFNSPPEIALFTLRSPRA